MKVALHVASFSWPDAPASIGPTLARFGPAAEEAGVSHVSLMDHFFQIPPLGEATQPMLEGYTGLGFLAAHTSTVTLQLLCTGVTYRNPGVLAKTVTTLDVLSGGRAALGIGAAWFEREHQGLGVAFPPLKQRFEMLEECLQICLQMWSENNGPYVGRHYELAETLCVPEPIARPRPPIMVAGGGEKKTLRLVAKYADSCNLFGGPTEVGAKLDILRGHCEAEGRDYASITPTVLCMSNPLDDLDAFVAEMAQLAKLGVGLVDLVPRGDLVAYTERVGKEIVPRLAELG
ncbi:MAG TPA: LLM class F420-dependent oxidoreductase [Sporichthyaceae bacterium]|nr:LLM class F420-dependent oxidoreductase [Sporichthyaceae bacterium]